MDVVELFFKRKISCCFNVGDGSVARNEMCHLGEVNCHNMVCS